MMFRQTSFRSSELAYYARHRATVDYVDTEVWGEEGPDGIRVPTDTIDATVRYLKAHEIASLAREQHGATARAECDLDVPVVEGDRLVWDRDPDWTYEIVGVDRAFEVGVLILRRVRA